MSKKKVPIVAIVGRANVGKSSLYNAILERREAIVADEPGTTRDSIMAKASIGEGENEQNFWIVDTAGLKAAEDDFEFTIQEQIIPHEFKVKWQTREGRQYSLERSA